ncbi:M20/M25/M40 family metallo-hydrolase [Paenarthrobacter sp. NPDC089714]|uniref:M20/M25/M40 family metallo-hydrolase n=1 Tax=Paenarthrobacter sp. NPDC089714 TaxID=3364377 RepID=UPI003802F8DB
MNNGVKELSSVATIARDLIQIDTTNFGNGESRGEEIAAQYVESRLTQMGLSSTSFSPEAGRTSLVSRIPGKDGSLPPLLLHGHLDVVPADDAGWTHDPYGGVIADGCLWGRGAVDMKNMVAMILASTHEMLVEGEQPQRDVILAFLADEEDRGRLGAQYLVDSKPELFAGAIAAVGEVGGYSVDVGGRRAYLVQTGEKSLTWLRLIARGPAGHGSRAYGRTAIARLAEAVARLSAHSWPVQMIEATDVLITAIRTQLGAPETLSPQEALASLGHASGFIEGGLSVTANTTVLRAGMKQNVVPAVAEALVDVRALPGGELEAIAEVRRLVGADIEVEVVTNLPGVSSPATGSVMEAMTASIRAKDPDALVLPYILPAGTDNKMFSQMGINGYGFAPMLLPAEFNFADMFHNVDERVPIESLTFGVGVLSDFLRRV